MKSKNGVFYLFLALTGLLFSCNIATTVHFNKDYSGTYMTVVDMSDLISMAGMADSTNSSDQSIADMRKSMDSLELEDVYNSVSGISDAKVDVSDKGVVSIGFKFDNVEALNASFKTVQESTAEKMSGSGDADMLPASFLGGEGQMFIREGKTITHSVDSEGLGLGDGEDSGDMDMMMNMIDYTIEFTFDRKIKSVDVEGLTILEQNSKNVKTRVDFGNFLKDGKYALSVKTK